MSSVEGTARLAVRIDLGAGADASDLDAAALALRRELMQLDVADVRRPPADPAPEGARGADATLLGALLVSASAGALPAVVGAIAAWMRRRPGRTVTLSIEGDRIEVRGASADTERELIDAFLVRHAPPR
ncbi:MAG TPA: hypothetical protein VN635_09500 [Conexibacter sp.]|nr:hypothetical protein [Conexibacter sp.]